MQPFYQLLRQLEDVRLAPHLLEPPLIRREANVAAENGTVDNIGVVQVGALGGRPSDMRNALSYHQNFSINIEKSDGSVNLLTERGETSDKQVPVWMQSSTVSGSFTANETLGGSNTLGTGFTGMSSSIQITEKTTTDIVGTLLSSEKINKIGDTVQKPASITNDLRSKNNQPEESSSDSDLEDVEETVTVNGKSFAISKITPQLVNQMTAEEKRHYSATVMRQMAEYD